MITQTHEHLRLGPLVDVRVHTIIRTHRAPSISLDATNSDSRIYRVITPNEARQLSAMLLRAADHVEATYIVTSDRDTADGTDG